jgi:hypothetical protein
VTNKEVKERKRMWRRRRGFFKKSHDKEDKKGYKKTCHNHESLFIIIRNDFHP